VLCARLGREQITRTHAHHLRQAQGWGKPSDWLTMAVCEEHHQGKSGIHGDKSALMAAKVDEFDLLADTLALLYGPLRDGGGS
jgi:hypothetical protein